MAYQSLPHGKTYAILAAEGIVARVKQVRQQLMVSPDIYL